MIKQVRWLLVSLSLWLASCGGGGTDVASGGVGSGGTGSYTSGPVSGLGSIIVNDIRYDVSSAKVQDDEGTVGLDESALQLGMVVEVQGTGITEGGSGQNDTATATSVSVASDFVGRVQSVTTSGASVTDFTLLDRTIDVDSKTVFTEPIATGDYVVVYGLVSPSGYTATRVKKLSSVPSQYKATGVVENLNTSLKRFNLGPHTVNYGLLFPSPKGLSNGAVVRVKWSASASTSILPTKIALSVEPVSDSGTARLNGLIAVLTDQKHFTVNGVPVDASALSLSGLRVGARVSIKGKMVKGVLVATSVKVETRYDIDGKDVELHGRVMMASPGFLWVHGVWVSYASSALRDGPVTMGECIEVKGKTYNTNNQLIATKISKESDCRP